MESCVMQTSFTNNFNNNTVTHKKVDVDNSDSANEGKIFIGGLCWQTTAETLKSYFGKFGEISDCTIMKDLVTKRSRGFGFVNFSNTDSVEKVLNSGPHTIDEKVVDAKVAVPRPKGGSNSSKAMTKTRKIFVGGLSAPTTADDIRRYFESFGAVTEAVLMIDKQTHRHRGFGFVTFEEDDVAEQVCQKPFHEINNKMVECKKALPKELMIPQTAAKNVFSVALPPAILTTCGRSFAVPGYYYHTGLGGYTLIPAAALNAQQATATTTTNDRLLQNQLTGNHHFITNGDFSGALVPQNNPPPQPQPQQQQPHHLQFTHHQIISQNGDSIIPRNHHLVFQRPLQSPVSTNARGLLSLFDYPSDFIIGVPVSNGYQISSPPFIGHPSPLTFSQSSSPTSIATFPGQVVTQTFQNGFH